MRLTLKNHYITMIKKIRKEAEEKSLIPNTFEVSHDELRKIVNEVEMFKPKSYTVQYKMDRREGDEKDNLTSSTLAPLFLRHRVNEVADKIIAGEIDLSYHGIPFVVVNDKTHDEETKPVGEE